MKKLVFILLFLTTIVVFEFCSSSKKAMNIVPKVSYASNVQHIIATNCSPCHVGPNAKQKKFNTYDQVKANIDDIVNRIERNPTDKGFMPFKHPKLADSTIQFFVKWKNDGLME